jgi:3-hydroxyisobutyrate dehydrogenase-like beta-hydroxyacid dehydrogenase
MKIAVIGLGEAGRAFATGLVDRGATVAAYDPAVVSVPAGVLKARSTEDAVSDAEIVFSTVGAGAAEVVADLAIPSMGRGGVFADLNPSSPDQKKKLAIRANEYGVLFADVAIMAPVTRAGIDTPCLVSGSGAVQFTTLRELFRVPVENVGTEAGAAARLKLLRSVFMKGLAALVFESLTAAEASGSEEWMRSQVVSELGESGEDLVTRLIDGTRVHAGRREHEMIDARAYLETLDSPTWITDATVNWLHRIASSSA